MKSIVKKLKQKNGEGEGKASYDLIGLILVIILIAVISVPISNTIKKGGVSANKNYQSVYNAIINSATSGSEVSIPTLENIADE